MARAAWTWKAAALALGVCGASAQAITITQAPAVNVAPGQVTVWWRTDVSGTTELHFGPQSAASAAAYPRHSVFSSLAGTLHSRTLSSLAPGTYYFRAQSSDGGAASALSSE